MALLEMPGTAQIAVRIFDGTRQPLQDDVSWLVRITDGRPLSERRAITRSGLKGSSRLFNVPFFDNSSDDYTVVISPDGFKDSGWCPVPVHPSQPASVDLLAMPSDAEPHFANATWGKLKAARPGVADIILRSFPDPLSAEFAYGQVLENRPKALACFLNIVAALKDMVLPSGKTPLDYYWNAAWPSNPKADSWLSQMDQVFKQDRFFCYVDANILPEIRAAAARKAFAPEQDPGIFHPGATESYKQTQFDVANVQLTFHGADTTSFTGPDGQPVNCIKVEPDIDYFKDLLNHGVGEVFCDWLTHGLTEPTAVYALRWMAGQRAGLAPFDPLYTVEAQASAASAARR